MGLIQLVGSKKYIAVMQTDGSEVSEVLVKEADQQIETGQPVMVSSPTNKDLTEAVYTDYATNGEIAEDPQLVREARSLIDLENHAHVMDGKVVIQKV